MMQSLRVIRKGLGKIGGYLSQSKLPNYLAGLIILLSSTQLGLHFWPPSSLVYGVRIDYLSPTLYFLDLLIILYLLFGYFKDCLKFGDWSLIIKLVPLLLTNLLYSQNPLATLSWSLHFLLYCLFFATLLPQFRSLRDSGRAIRTSVITVILTLSLLLQSITAMAQVSLGHSIGGLWYYLGERSVAVGQPGVALATFMDMVVLRAYGTFGHPNVLAGWLVVALLIILKLTPVKKMIIDYWLLFIATSITIIGVLLAQSRAAGLSLIGIIIPLLLIKKLRLRFLYAAVSLLVCWFVYPTLFSPPRSDLSLTQRLALQDLSLSVIADYPIFGTGAQASISTYPAVSPTTRLLQPDHNSITLFLSWFGFFGVLAIIYSLKNCLKFDYWNLVIILPLLPPLLLDHYFLTSPQGLFIILLYVQVALNYTHVQNHR